MTSAALHPTPWAAASDAIREAREGRVQAGVIRVVFFGQDRGCYYREGNPVSDAKVPLDAQIAAQRRVLASIKPDEESTREIEATIALLEWLQANAEPLRAFVKAQRASA